MIDYLTFSIHYDVNKEQHRIITDVIILTDMLKPVVSKAYYPYTHNDKYYLNGIYVMSVRYARTDSNRGFVTFELNGSYFNFMDRAQERVSKVFRLISEESDFESFKIARIDLCSDFDSVDTCYNPNSLPLVKTFYGKCGQPSYYYGSSESLIRCYDKKNEMLTVDGIEIDADKLTRIEFQFRDIYVKREFMGDIIQYADQWLNVLLAQKFNLSEPPQDFVKPVSTKPQSDKGLERFKPYTTMCKAIIDIFGEKFLLDYIYLNSKKDTTKYIQSFKRDAYLCKDSSVSPATEQEVLYEWSLAHPNITIIKE